MEKRFITAMFALCTMAAFLFTLTFTACDDDDDSDASTYEIYEIDDDRDTIIIYDVKADGSINGYDYVDLGLSVVWATCNVGASSSEDYGDYYAWGETSTKSSYDEDNCETYGEDIDDISGTNRDVAHVKWGETWRMPTQDEQEELVNYCTLTWTTLNKVNGWIVADATTNVTYKPATTPNVPDTIIYKSIFLPAAGHWYGTLFIGAGGLGNYVSSTPDESNTQDACYLYLRPILPSKEDKDEYWHWGYRCYGRSVRPVSEL